MICAKCGKNEATVHITAVMNDKQEAIDLCKECAPASLGVHILDPKALEALSVIGKPCEFCGKKASSGEMLESGGAIYWCASCGREFGRILSEMLSSEQPDFMRRGKQGSSLLSFLSDPALRAWSEAAYRKAVQQLKERRNREKRS